MKNNWRTEDKYGPKDAEKEIERLKEEIKKRDKQITTLKQKVRILLRDIETKNTEIKDVRRTGTAAFADIYTLQPFIICAGQSGYLCNYSEYAGCRF